VFNNSTKPIKLYQMCVLFRDLNHKDTTSFCSAAFSHYFRVYGRADYPSNEPPPPPKYLGIVASGLFLNWHRPHYLPSSDTKNNSHRRSQSLAGSEFCLWICGFCTVCEVNLPTTFRKPLWVPHSAHTLQSQKKKKSILLR
jgi:hypothetical protein